ncbi:MAG: hypothetical protein COW13_03795 [Candidatus Omnitrophica bacterium CG12_big_fil_rev_8_21_14_0_65_50_5]|nr:MAG: hypothetical protein COW13_03795 [Candidatus Omnitrophica bacterium CG12_big_fil_rev_8_21_14_0_65_50_5]
MKKMIFNRDVKPDRGFKRFVVSEKDFEEGTITHVRKSFSYHMARCPRHLEPQRTEPEVFIRKHADQRRGLEMVKFEVKGKIYTRHDHASYEIIFHHVLNIHILRKDLSPNNTALT